MKTKLIILLALVALAGKAQSLKSDTIFLNAMPGVIWHGTDNLIKKDTAFCLMLQTEPGMQLNPTSWTIEKQSQIDMVWTRGYAIIEYGVPKSYLYIDKKTKVTRKVYYTIFNP